jgi:hypothetical protein
MSNEFSLEAAKRGEAVQWESHSGWHDAHFVGVMTDGSVVIEFAKVMQRVTKACLRMSPKTPKTMWIQVYHTESGQICIAGPFQREDVAHDSVDGYNRIGQPQPILVEEV